MNTPDTIQLTLNDPEDYLSLRHHIKNIIGEHAQDTALCNKYPIDVIVRFDTVGRVNIDTCQYSPCLHQQFNSQGLISFLQSHKAKQTTNAEAVGTSAADDPTPIKPKEEIYKRLPKPAPICIQISEAGYDYLHNGFESATEMGTGDILRQIQHEGGWSMQMELHDVFKAIQNGFLLPEHILNWRP
jgi:hypothetical protein